MLVSTEGERRKEKGIAQIRVASLGIQGGKVKLRGEGEARTTMFSS